MEGTERETGGCWFVAAKLKILGIGAQSGTLEAHSGGILFEPCLYLAEKWKVEMLAV